MFTEIPRDLCRNSIKRLGILKPIHLASPQRGLNGLSIPAFCVRYLVTLHALLSKENLHKGRDQKDGGLNANLCTRLERSSKGIRQKKVLIRADNAKRMVRLIVGIYRDKWN